VAKILLISGSVFGAATITTDEIETALDDAGHRVVRPDPPELHHLTDTSIDWLVICCSSTGNGDIPDELLPIYTVLVNDNPKIIHLSYLVIALGDSSYEIYCGGGLTMDAAVADAGAKRITEPFQIDALETTEPEAIAPPWVIDTIAEHTS